MDSGKQDQTSCKEEVRGMVNQAGIKEKARVDFVELGPVKTLVCCKLTDGVPLGCLYPHAETALSSRNYLLMTSGSMLCCEF